MIFPLAFPPNAVSQETLRIASNQAAMESPHTFAQQVVFNADHWLLEFNWPRMSHAQAEQVQAWLDSLQGQVGTFRYRPRSATTSTLTSRSLALSASPYSTSISVGGWTANSATSLSRGQYLQLGDRLHRVVSAPLNADAQGRCAIEVAPQVRAQQPAGTPVEFVAPTGTFRLTSSDGIGFTLDTDRKPSFPTINAKEAL